jgi:hypothetical protein
VEPLLDGRCGGFVATGGSAAELVSAAAGTGKEAVEDENKEEEPTEAGVALINAARV